MANITYGPITLDVLISDVKSSDLHAKVSEILRKKYLSDSTEELNEVKGILFGDFQRLLCTMTLEIKGQIKNIHFLVDTGSPSTFVCEEAINSYNLLVDPKGPIPVRLNKRQISVKVSDNDNFRDLNLLGTDFLTTHRAVLYVDFDEKYFTIKFKSSQTEISPTDINDLGSSARYHWILLIVIFILGALSSFLLCLVLFK